MNEEKNLPTDTETIITYDILLATVLPCPFCGQKPEFEKGYVPSFIQLMCLNYNCPVQPSLTVKVKSTPWDKSKTTFKPEFEQLRDLWNIRS